MERGPQVLRGRGHRCLLPARLVRRGQHPQADHALRRDRAEPLLLVRLPRGRHVHIWRAVPAAAHLVSAGRRASSHRLLADPYLPEGAGVPGPGQLAGPGSARCRMGICGADPVAIVAGMPNLSGITDDERATLERLGLAENTRMACCCRVDGPVSVSLTPEQPKKLRPSQVLRLDFDPSVERVVVVGNGIAGITAADYVRRNHPESSIDVIADEAYHLYNRMAITRLIYGRSAMQGLYLNPDAWYESRSITPWLNTRVQAIDRTAREVVTGTGERIPYDRLILATGSSSTVPPIGGWGGPGTFVLRSADDALRVRAFAQLQGARRAVIAGGGLLGLEAAYALHKLGLATTVLERSERLLRRQLDPRAAFLLQRYMEGIGIAVWTEAETDSVSGNG